MSKVYRFADKVGRFYSQPERARELVGQINDICDSKPGLHWNRLPDVNKIAQLKSLVRFTAPYNGRDDRGTKCNWKNMDVVILEHVKKRLTDRDNTEPSFLRVYRAFQKYFDYHNELPDAGYIIGKMLPELASPEAREVDSELRRHELSYGRTLESQRKMRGIINRKLS